MTKTKKDFRLEWFSGTGAGGQHRNKHQNCCRITDKETGLYSTGQNHKSRVSNQEEAFNKLINKLLAREYTDKQRYQAGTEVIRNYHKPRNDVYDKASGKHFQYSAILDDISSALEARRKVMGAS